MSALIGTLLGLTPVALWLAGSYLYHRGWMDGFEDRGNR